MDLSSPYTQPTIKLMHSINKTTMPLMWPLWTLALANTYRVCYTGSNYTSGRILDWGPFPQSLCVGYTSPSAYLNMYTNSLDCVGLWHSFMDILLYWNSNKVRADQRVSFTKLMLFLQYFIFLFVCGSGNSRRSESHLQKELSKDIKTLASVSIPPLQMHSPLPLSQEQSVLGVRLWPCRNNLTRKAPLTASLGSGWWVLLNDFEMSLKNHPMESIVPFCRMFPDHRAVQQWTSLTTSRSFRMRIEPELWSFTSECVCKLTEGLVGSSWPRRTGWEPKRMPSQESDGG